MTGQGRAPPYPSSRSVRRGLGLIGSVPCHGPASATTAAEAAGSAGLERGGNALDACYRLHVLGLQAAAAA